MIKRALFPLLLSLASVIPALYVIPAQAGIHLLLEGGGYQSTQGQSQRININGLIGDQFNVSNRHDNNTIFGVGFLQDGLRKGNVSIDYGINAFYLAKTKVSGTITQEFLFTNLAYRYYVSHLPVYLFAKGKFGTSYPRLSITADAGVGPNFMDANLYQDSPLNSNSVPDNAFSGNHTSTELSGMLGIGLQYMAGSFPIEFGYRYFYLGSSSLSPRTNQILNNLKTGNISAQALILTVSV